MSSHLYIDKICDPHIHFFPLSTLEYEWLSGPKQCEDHPFLGKTINNIRHEFFLEDHLRESKMHNVVKFVHVQVTECKTPYEEVQYCDTIAKQHPQLGGIVAFANLMDDGEVLNNYLSSISKFSHLRGIRQLLNFHDTHEHLRDTPVRYAREPKWIENLSLLEKYGLHFEYHGFPTQLQDLRAIASKYPELNFIVNHAGLLYDFDENSVNLWKEETALLGKFPNVYMKISGLYMIRHSLDQGTLQSVVDHLIHAFTTDKLMFASNYPVEKAVISYDDLYAAFKKSVEHLSDGDQHKMFYQNAMKFYRLSEN